MIKPGRTAKVAAYAVLFHKMNLLSKEQTDAIVKLQK